MKIAPSILAANLSNLGGAVETAAKGGADLIHLDVIDGRFAPNISFGPGTIRALRTKTKIPFDVHLMIEQPRNSVRSYIEAGADRVIVQAETIDEAGFDALFAVVRSHDRSLGVALKPGTEMPDWVERRLGRLSTILVLTVNPGFSGQRMDVSQFPKIERIAKVIAENQFETDLEIDGGVDERNIGEVAKRGGDTIVAGAGVYAQQDPAQAIARLRENATKARSAS